MWKVKGLPVGFPSPPRRRGPRFWLSESGSRVNRIMQVKPMGIDLFNNSKFPRAIPFLDLLFASDGVFHLMMVLIPDKLFQSILLREAIKNFILVGSNPGPESAGDTDIHCAPVAVRHDVHCWGLLVLHPLNTMFCRSTVKVRGTPAFAGVTNSNQYVRRHLL